MNEQAKLVRWLTSLGSVIQASPLHWWGPCSPAAASALWSTRRPASRQAGHQRRSR